MRCLSLLKCVLPLINVPPPHLSSARLLPLGPCPRFVVDVKLGQWELNKDNLEKPDIYIYLPSGGCTVSISGYQLPCGLPPWTPASSSGQANQKINKTWNNMFNRFTRTNTDSVSKMVSICRLLANSPYTRELTPIEEYCIWFG